MTLDPIVSLKFIYTQRPVFTMTIPWHQQAFAVAAQAAYQHAQQQETVLASAWHPPTDAHHLWHRWSPLSMRQHPNYLDFQDAHRLGIMR